MMGWLGSGQEARPIDGSDGKSPKSRFLLANFELGFLHDYWELRGEI